jgi:pteridine reductase
MTDVSHLSDFSGSRPIAMVTGAARAGRVGLASATALARSGCDILITYNHSRSEAESAVASLQSLGAAARADHIDLSDLPATESWSSQLATKLPRLDILVHNASTYAPTPLAELTIESLLRNYNVHLAAPALLTKHLTPLLARSPLPGAGSIVCMCDIHALGRPRKDYLAYNTSKAALAQLVTTLARELAPRIRVNGVAPGAVAFADQGPDADPQMQQQYLSRVPLARSGTPAEAAEAVRWLSLDATYTTGEIIRVDGGRWIT